ncbi:hypothetical protein NFI96_030204, partial [Prochilodus magdalenae]
PPLATRNCVRAPAGLIRQKMASACRRLVCANEKRGVRQDLDSWRSKLIQCVGTEKIVGLLLGTRILEDLRLFKDYKPASVSNWSFDESCLFCCLRREKVKSAFKDRERLRCSDAQWEFIPPSGSQDREESGRLPSMCPQGRAGRDELYLKHEGLEVCFTFLFFNPQEHVIALNNKIVESGGKPLLGKDHCNISRLEWQVEEFLNAVLHRKEYTPRIPDPHIPVVACDTMQQMIGQLVVHYTSNTNSQGSPQHNGNMDQSLLKPCSITSPTVAATASPAASAQNPVLSKLLMADQDAPLDLSVKKVKPEIVEQDGVLDLSIKKNRNPDSSPLRSPQKTFSKPFVSRDSLDLGLTTESDVQSASTLEQFMAKLCLHHQRQVVDAFGFLQTEVKAVASTSTFPVSSTAVPEKPTTSGNSHETLEERTRNWKSEEPPPLPVAISTSGVQESPPAVKSNDLSHAEQPLKTEGSPIASVKTGPSIDLSKVDSVDKGSPSSSVVGAECKSTDVQPKCPTLLIVKNRNSGSLEAKNLTEEGSGIQQVNTGTVDQGLCASDTRLQASSSESDVVELPSSVEHSEPNCCAVERSLPVHSNGSTATPCTVQRTSNVISPITTRTARKSRRGSHSLQRDSSGCHVVNGPDIMYDIVYVGKSITECDLESQNHMLPRRNARKSTRGYRYMGDCWELKTVRTLARKSAENGSGNCPVPMPEMTTSVTPKHAVAKPDGVPPMDIPVAGDFMETVINNKPSDQPAETEVPEDVMASEDVETSQTGQTQNKEQVSLVESEHSDTSAQEDLNAGICDTFADSNDMEIDQADPVDPTEADINVPPQEVKHATKETLDAPLSSVTPNRLETENQDQNVATEPLQSILPLDMDKEGVCDSEIVCLEKDVKDQNVRTEKDVIDQNAPTENDVKDQNVPTESDAKDQNVKTDKDVTDQNVPTEKDAKDPNVQTEKDAKDQNVPTEALVLPECVELQAVACTDENAVLEMTCGTETNLKPGDGIKATEDKDAEAGTSTLSVEENTTKEQPEESKEEKLVASTLDSPSPKKVAVKNTVSSDRCLRSRVSKGTSEQTLLSSTPGQTETSPDSPCKNQSTPESKRPLKALKSKHVEENVPCEDSPCNPDAAEHPDPEKTQKSPVVTPKEDVGKTDMVRTRQQQKLMKEMESSKEQNVPELATPKEDDKVRGQGCPSNDVPENVEVTPPKSGESPGKSLRSSERMPLRNSTHQPEQAVKVSSPVKNAVQTFERMPLRNRNTSVVDQPVGEESSSSPTGGRSEKQARMPLRSRDSYNAEQVVKDPCNSPSQSSSGGVGRMPLRSRNSSTVDHNESGNVVKDVSNSLAEQSSSDSLTSKKTESPGHMPLRSGSASVAEQPSKNASSGGNVLESPSRMSLRRSTTPVAEKMDSPTTPPKSIKPSQRPQRSLKTSVPSSIAEEEEESPNSVKFKAEKPVLKDQAKDSSLPDNSSSVNRPPTTSAVPSPSKFLEVLNGEENQHLISDLNTKFDKMQKGWVQMDKEGQPAPKPKNKADRLKEIWKSKKRIRKPRSLEQQKFSPVQMLFMKSFDLPSICRWFLQSTETKSLVIVKKVNTRLPSETQLCFHTSASVPGSSNGVFPSVQAERLKKHLKKFAIASPVKSNPKNKRLIAKALAQGISVSKAKEKQEPSTATRISTKPHSYSGLMQPQPSEIHSKVTANAKNPASARILRKYSNMREKMQVQQNTLKKLESSLDKTKKVRVMPKNVPKAMPAGKGQRSAIVKKVKALAKKAKSKSAVKEKAPKNTVSRALRGLKVKAAIPAKKVLPKVKRTNSAADTKTPSKKEAPVKADKSPQTKNDIKKLHSPKGRDSLASQAADVKSEDQVLTRSQRKTEVTLAQTGSPKTATKRAIEPVSTPAKRTRTSK